MYTYILRFCSGLRLTYYKSICKVLIGTYLNVFNRCLELRGKTFWSQVCHTFSIRFTHTLRDKLTLLYYLRSIHQKLPRNPFASLMFDVKAGSRSSRERASILLILSSPSADFNPQISLQSYTSSTRRIVQRDPNSPMLLWSSNFNVLFWSGPQSLLTRTCLDMRF